MFLNNLGPMDRLVRICIGIALLAMIVLPPNTAWGWLGVIPLLTGLLGTCPLYRLVGLDTCPLD